MNNIKDLYNDKNLKFWFDQTKELSSDQQDQFYNYYQLINEYNKVMNLTGIDDLYGVYLKHFYDSITIDKLIVEKQGVSIGDLGSGAGFPGIILAIIYPNSEIYLIEPLKKRCNFLEIVVRELNLTNVTILNQRAEEIDIKCDYIVSRAVARLNILLELAIPIVKKDGYFIALKGLVAEEEIKEAKNALNLLSTKIETIEKITLPIENSTRSNIKFLKTKETNDKYPRNYGTIKNKPL